MDHALGVSCRQGASDLPSDGQGFVEGSRARAQSLPQRLPFQIRHGQKGVAVALRNLVDRADVGME